MTNEPQAHLCEMVSHETVKGRNQKGTLLRIGEIGDFCQRWNISDASWYSHSQFVSTLDYFDAYRKRINDSAINAKLLRMKNEILKHVPTARFKEYFTIKVGISTADDSYYIIVAVSKEFDEVCILRDINDRSNFFRSLGPEFVDLSHAVDHYRDKVLEVAFPKSTTTKNK